MRAASLVLLSAMALLATPLISAAQESGKTPRVAYVRSGSFANDPYREPFLRGMRERGWIAGRNIAFEFRYYGDDAKAIALMMHDLLRLKIDVIAVGGAAATRAAQAATRSVPIVMTAGDPLAGGLITSLARPGGNTTLRAWPADAVIALDDSAFIANRRELATQAIRHRLPLMCGFPELAKAGCLVSYTVSIVDAWYRLAAYVDTILEGTKPGDLPVQQASKFELLINLKTAKALGLTIPQSLLLRADHVIE